MKILLAIFYLFKLSFSMLFKSTKNNPKRECSDIRIVVYYPLLILSTNSFGVSISILEKPTHFLPKSLMDAPM